MKIILNKCFGGFGVSREGYELYAKKINKKIYAYDYEDYGNDIFRRTYKDSGFNCYFTKDFGEVAKISDEDYKKYILNLTEDYREDKALIEVVEELGGKASGGFAELEVVEIPDNSFYKIDEYDGVETIYYSESEIKVI